jgi:hypothetical protein
LAEAYVFEKFSRVVNGPRQYGTCVVKEQLAMT